jgi:hypothetical protein
MIDCWWLLVHHFTALNVILMVHHIGVPYPVVLGSINFRNARDIKVLVSCAAHAMTMSVGHNMRGCTGICGDMPLLVNRSF